MMEFLVEAALKSVPITTVAFATLWLMKRKSASARFTLLAAIFATLAILPLAVVISPKIEVIEKPVAVSSVSTTMLSTEVVTIVGQGTSSLPLAATTPVLTVEQGLLMLWLLGLLACWTSLARDILTGLKHLPSPTRRGASIAWAKEDSFGPFVWGWLRPRVVLPSALRDWDHTLRSALIAHEMAHVQRGDWPLRIAFRLVRGLYWFNPLVWILEKRASIESELACDDLVVTAGADPARYAEGLLEVAKMQRLTTAPGAGSPRLKTRLLALFDNTRDRSQAGRGIKMGALAIAIAGVGVIAPLSVGSEAPVEKTWMPDVLREPQSTIKQMPAKAIGQNSATSKGGVNKVTSTSKKVQGSSNRVKGTEGASTVSQGQQTPNSVNRAGAVNAAPAQGQAPTSVNQAQGGSGVSQAGQGSVSIKGTGAAAQGGGGGGTASVNRAGGQGGGVNVSGQNPAGIAQGGGGGGGGSFGSGQGSSNRASGGTGQVSVGGAGGSGGTLNGSGAAASGGFGKGDTVATGGRGGSGSIGPGTDGNFVSAVSQSDEPLGTKIVDMGDGLFRVTHVTELGKFTAQGRNIELYKNGVLTLNAKLAANQKAVRHVAGYVTSAMSGRGSMAFVRPDAP